MPDVLAVTYRVGRSRALAGVQLLLVIGGALMAAGMHFWTFAGVMAESSAAVLIVLWVFIGLSVAAAVHFWRAQRPRTLRWDGEHWFLGDADGAVEQGGADARVGVRADAQRWMLLHWHLQGRRGGVWLWAEAASDPARWSWLRCALYLPQPSAGETSAREADAERA